MDAATQSGGPAPRRILVVGSSGSGKSTLARELGSRYELPVIHLDGHFWTPGWVALEREPWRAACRELAADDAWVMDGNYGSSLDIRLPRAELIVFPDLPPALCVYRGVRRWWRHRGRERADLAAGCPDRIEWQWLRYIWDYRRRHRGRLLTAIARYAPDTPLVRLRSRRQVRDFLRRAAA